MQTHPLQSHSTPFQQPQFSILEYTVSNKIMSLLRQEDRRLAQLNDDFKQPQTYSNTLPQIPFRPHPFDPHLRFKQTGPMLKNLFWKGRQEGRNFFKH